MTTIKKRTTRRLPFPRPGSITIAPSVLSANFASLATEVRKVDNAGCAWLHLDIMDNHFVPNLTFGPPVVERIRPISKRLFFDTHLMVEKPETLIPQFAKAGSQLITVHEEACRGNLPKVIRLIRDNGARVGVAIKPGTPVSAVEVLAAEVDLLLVMTVEPGFGGQQLIPACLSKISQLKSLRARKRLRFLIEVDGGINKGTAELAVAAGADILVAGSAVFQDGNVARNVQQLEAAAAQAVS